MRTDELEVRGEAPGQLELYLSQDVLSPVGNSGKEQRLGLPAQGRQSELLSRLSAR